MREHQVVRSFEGARGAAALLVALYHFALRLPTGLHFPGFITHSYLFVDLFFVLSGYVICSSYEERLHGGSDLRTFVIRRFGRLFPLLIFSTVAYVLIENVLTAAKYALVIVGHQHMFAHPDSMPWTFPDLPQTLATITLTHGLGLFDHSILNYASWSISTEFYTYLVFAGLCLVIPGRARLAAFAVLAAATFALTCWASIVRHGCVATDNCLDVTFDFGLTRCIASFFLGALVFHAARHARAASGWLQLAVLAAIALLFFLLARVPLLALAFPGAFALLLFSLSTDRGPVARLFSSRFALMLGERSYSIYLMHPPLLILFALGVRRMAGGAIGIASVMLYATALIVISGLTYRFVEQPSRELFNRWARRQRVPRGVTPSY